MLLLLLHMHAAAAAAAAAAVAAAAATQKLQAGGQINKTKVTCHHLPLLEHVQEASCGGVQDVRRRGPYGQDVWSP